MVYLRYLGLAVLNVLVTFGIAYPFAFILPIFAKPLLGWCDNHSYEAVEPRLPKWMNWLMTPDNSLNGDATFQRLNPPSFLSQGKWLWRNPAYGVGIKYMTGPFSAKIRGDNTIRDNDNAKKGWVFIRINNLFQFVCIIPIGFQRCIMVNMGWNIRALVDPNAKPDIHPYEATFAFTPFRLSGFR